MFEQWGKLKASNLTESNRTKEYENRTRTEYKFSQIFNVKSLQRTRTEPLHLVEPQQNRTPAARVLSHSFTTATRLRIDRRATSMWLARDRTTSVRRMWVAWKSHASCMGVARQSHDSRFRDRRLFQSKSGLHTNIHIQAIPTGELQG